jgi:C1A family cysteine protease
MKIPYSVCVYPWIIALGCALFGVAQNCSADLPSSYDLRDYGWMTSVKDQGDIGSCWTFATMASIESNVLVQGGSSMDYSENNLKNNHGFPYSPFEGGDYDMALAYLTRLSGPVLEAQDPYHPYDDGPSPTFTADRFLQSAWFPDTASEYKSVLMNRGAVSVGIAYVDTSYNPSDFTFYLDHPVEANHGVTLVGWDDNKVTASANAGAWLIKNSWGTEWGDAGYFWISYDDPYLGSSSIPFNHASFETVAMPSDLNLRCYGYDFLGNNAKMQDIDAAGAFFTRSAADEALYSLGFYTLADGASYTLKIFDSFDSLSMTPSSELYSTNGVLEMKGYHTIAIDEVATLGVDDDFFVEMILNGSDYAYDANATGTGNTFQFKEGIWSDLNGDETIGSFCLKVFTVAPVPESSHLAAILSFGILIFVGIRRNKNGSIR